MQESVCESGESVKGLSLRALRARAGGDHLSAQLWTNFGTIWDQLWTNLGPIGTDLGPIWHQSGNNLGQNWHQFETALESENEHFS